MSESDEIKAMLYEIKEGHASCKASVHEQIKSLKEEMAKQYAKLEKLTNGHNELRNQVVKIGAYMGLLGGGLAIAVETIIKHIFP